MAIPASQIVSVNPRVLQAGGNDLVINGLFLTENSRIPLSSIAMTFPTVDSVGEYFGLDSAEYEAAQVYFRGYDNSFRKPVQVLFARRVVEAAAGWIRGAAYTGTLEELKAVTAGDLTVSIDGEEKPEGSIYTENYNSKDFEDPNTVIYGHDMKNGSMFRTLHNYMDRTFFDNNKDVIIYTPDAIRHYRIFAAYLYDNRHILESYDNFQDPAVFQGYLNEVLLQRDMNAFIDTQTEVGVDDKIITMSTCYGTQHNVRYLVQAVLVSIEK